jgi:hypothetical protein
MELRSTKKNNKVERKKVNYSKISNELRQKLIEMVKIA